MRGENTPEDYIPCIVFARLRKELGLTYESISADTGIPVTTLSGMAGFSVVANPGRILKLAEYFRRSHGLGYVTADYFLGGGPEDRERIETIKKQEEIKKAQDSKPPFMEWMGD